MKRFFAIAHGMAVALGFALTPGWAQESGMRPAVAAPPVPVFLKVEAIDFAALVPAPPVAGSLAVRAEIETLLNVQVARTEADVAWAQLVDKDNVFNHAAVLGAWFTREKLPVLAEFFESLRGDIRAIDLAAKKPFLRERPWKADPRVQPCVQLPTSSAYPSGSAMQAHLWAAILAELFPDQSAALFARAQRAAWGRVIGGVHYPSDLTGGRILAESVMAELRKNAAFRAALEKCRAEAAAVVKAKAG